MLINKEYKHRRIKPDESDLHSRSIHEKLIWDSKEKRFSLFVTTGCRCKPELRLHPKSDDIVFVKHNQLNQHKLN